MGTAELKLPVVRLNDHPLRHLRMERRKTSRVVSGSVSELKTTPRPGENQFVLSAPTPATLLSLNVAIVP